MKDVRVGDALSFFICLTRLLHLSPTFCIMSIQKNKEDTKADAVDTERAIQSQIDKIAR